MGIQLGRLTINFNGLVLMAGAEAGAWLHPMIGRVNAHPMAIRLRASPALRSASPSPSSMAA